MPEYRAVKIISKERVIKTKQAEHTTNEKNILNSLNIPFIVKLFDYFKDSMIFLSIYPSIHPSIHPSIYHNVRGHA